MVVNKIRFNVYNKIMYDLSQQLEIAREDLPPNIDVSDEHILLASLPRGDIRRSFLDSFDLATSSRSTFDNAGQQLAKAASAYLTVTPLYEYISDPGQTAEGGTTTDAGETQITVSFIPSDEQLGRVVGDEAISGSDQEPGTPDPLIGLFTDGGKTIHAREALVEARSKYDVAKLQLDKTQAELDLAKRARGEARRLSRVPKIIVAAGVGVAALGLLGGPVHHDEQRAHTRAQEHIASGTLRPGSSEYNGQETLANNILYDLEEGGTESGAAFMALLGWFAVSDRPARTQARIIVRLAKRKAKATAPEEND
jgi:hypothetical protein